MSIRYLQFMRASLIFLLALFLAAPSIAQRVKTAQRPKFTDMTGPGPLSRTLVVGIKGGANLAFLPQAPTWDERLQRRPGYQAGAYLRFNPVKVFSAQLEALYHAQGWETILAGQQISYEQNGESYQVLPRMELNTLNAYLTFPFSTYLNVSPYLSVGVGLEPGLLLSSVAKGRLIYEEINQGGFQTSEAIAVDFLKDEMGDPAGAYAFFTQNGAPMARNGDLFTSYLLNANLMTRLQLGRSLSAEFRFNYRLTDLVNDYYDTQGSLQALNRLIIFQTILAYEFPVSRAKPGGF